MNKFSKAMGVWLALFSWPGFRFMIAIPKCIQLAVTDIDSIKGLSLNITL
jgi:hypothetical protein